MTTDEEVREPMAAKLENSTCACQRK